jgi:hypothetical protein
MFIGTNGVPDNEIVLVGNDLSPGAKAMSAGVSYVHLP